MPRPSSHPRIAGNPARPAPLAAALASLVIVCAAVLCYARALNAPFIFDDHRAILENNTIRHLWPLTGPLSPPSDGGGVIGRPLVNLSFAINYAWGGTAVRGYHLFNVLLHALNGLILYGIVRRTLLRSFPLRPTERGLPLTETAAAVTAFCIALLWVVHPLQTESVTCIVQRTELLVGFFYGLTLYLFIRGVDSPRSSRMWFSLSVAAGFAGMASKEVMVTAPVVLFLYDRTFLGGTFREAWRRRKAFHLSLACSWGLLAVLMAGSPHRAGVVGFETGVSFWDYLLTQCRALGIYLRLSFWPHPLVVDYGTTLVGDPRDVLLPGLLVLLLLVGTVFALWRRPAVGFLGAVFFLILAPSSSFVPLASQPIAEHRVYLPLAAILSLIVIGGRVVFGARSLGLFFALALPAAWCTSERNKIYGSELMLWTDTVLHAPTNGRAHSNLGNVLRSLNRVPEAMAEYQTAIRLQPTSPYAYINLAAAFLQTGQPALAVESAGTAVRLDPKNVDAHVNLGLALVALRRAAEAVPHFEEAQRLEPGSADIHAPFGAALLQVGRGSESIEHLKIAVSLQPENVTAWTDLARAFFQAHDLPRAREAGEHVLRLAREFSPALYLLGNIEAADSNFEGAIAYYRRALSAAPADRAARNNLANVLLLTGRVDEAIREYQEILRQHPEDAAVKENLARALQMRR